MDAKIYKHGQRGFALINIIIALVILSPIIGFGAKAILNYHDRAEAATAASQHLKVVEAARSYLRDNMASGLVEDGNVIFTLINEGYLESSLATNAFGQEFIVEYYGDASGSEAIQTAIAAVGFNHDKISHYIARGLGASSLYVSLDGHISPMNDDTSVLSFDFNNYDSLTDDHGTIVYVDTFNQKAEVSDYLYRHKVAGFPELNMMKTHLDMDHSDINNVGVITFSNEGDNGVTIGDQCGVLNDNDGFISVGHGEGDTAMLARVNGEQLIAECRYGRWAAIGNPIGTVAAFIYEAVPDGWLIADGSSFHTSDYPKLRDFLGSNELPDLRGMFLRGHNMGRSDGFRDPDGDTRKFYDYEVQESANKRHNHRGNTSSAGEHSHSGTTTTNGNHRHSGTTNKDGNHGHRFRSTAWGYTSPGGTLLSGGGGLGRSFGSGLPEVTSTQHIVNDGSHTHSFNTNYAGSHSHSLNIVVNGEHNHIIYWDGIIESRPNNIAVVYAIKAL